jgi:hypothetical protein
MNSYLMAQLACECGQIMAHNEDFTISCHNPDCDQYFRRFKIPAIELAETPYFTQGDYEVRMRNNHERHEA